MKHARSGRIGVIGGGLGGLAAACTLAARGYDVVLFEKNPWLGGKAAVLSEGGFRFDMGPTILTDAVGPAADLRRGGPRPRRRARPVRLDPQWRCFFADGTTLDLHRRHRRDGARPSTRSPRAASRRRAIASSSTSPSGSHDISRALLLLEVDRLGRATCSTRARRSSLSHPRRRAAHAALEHRRRGTIRSHVRDPRVAQMLDHFTQYVGSSPDLSPAVLCGIAHMQTGEGVWYPRGGTRAVPEALVQLAGELGVEFRTGVRRAHDPDRAATAPCRASRLDDGEQVSLAAVVSNCDSVRTHRELLGRDARGSPRSRSGAVTSRLARASSSTSGLDRRYEQLLHHNFVFSRDPHEEFDFIYRKGEPAPDPTCYVCAPARHRARRRPARRRGPLRPGAHALPAAAPRLEADVPRLPPDDPREAQVDRAACTTSRSGSWSSGG